MTRPSTVSRQGAATRRPIRRHRGRAPRDSAAASPGRAGGGVLAVFLAPALVLFLLLVAAPDRGGRLRQHVQVERLRAAGELHRAGQLHPRLQRPDLPRRPVARARADRAVPGRPAARRAGPGHAAQPAAARPGRLPADVLRPVRPLRGDHRRPVHAGVLARTGGSATRSRGRSGRRTPARSSPTRTPCCSPSSWWCPGSTSAST